MPLTLGKSRIEALSDGVFAIAMTLLVLKLDVPEVMHHSSNEAMLQQLLAMGPVFVTYIVTFLIAGGFWFRKRSVEAVLNPGKRHGRGFGFPDTEG